MTAPLPAPGGNLTVLQERAKFGSAVYFDLQAWGQRQQSLPVLSAGAKMEGGGGGRA